MTGVEGYIESAASGFVAGLNAARQAKGEGELQFPHTTMIGAMARYISQGGMGKFQPMNANFGLTPPLEVRVKGPKSMRNEAAAHRALAVLEAFCAEEGIHVQKQ